MKPVCLFLLIAAALPAETTLKAGRTAHVLVLNEVYLNGQGPFRMMVDTGNESSLLRPALARRLGLHPSGVVDHVTVSGVRLAPIALLDEVRAGGVTDQIVEAILADPLLPGVDGVLGQSWLVRHDYLIDYRNRRLVLDGAPPPGGLRLALRSSDGRPAVVAEVDGRRRDLVLDSGAPALVLFEPSGRPSARLSLGESYRRTLQAVYARAPQPAAGLMPLSAFASVYICNRDGFVVLAR